MLNTVLIILTGAVVITLIMGIHWLVKTLWNKIDSEFRSKIASAAATTAIFACVIIMAGFICYGIGFIFLAVSAALGFSFPIHL